MLQEQINLKWKELFKARDAIGKSAFECLRAKLPQLKNLALMSFL
jgi:hypothetical protein